jgi:hypothetical protein
VNNWRRALRADGRRHAKTLGHGPAPRLDAGAREVLRELVTADNDATLAEYRDQLYERTGIRVSPAVLCLTEPRRVYRRPHFLRGWGHLNRGFFADNRITLSLVIQGSRRCGTN